MHETLFGVTLHKVVQCTYNFLFVLKIMNNMPNNDHILNLTTIKLLLSIINAIVSSIILYVMYRI